MSGIGLDYAERTDLKNAPVRELDVARLRRLWTGVGVAFLLAVLLVFTAWQQFRIARIGYDLEFIDAQWQKEDHLHEHLLLEADTLRSPARLAHQAEKLHLVPPPDHASFVIERVTTDSLPDQTVIALR